jgi:hypothetical protein
MDLSGSGVSQVAEFCKHENEYFVSIIDGEYFTR